MYRFLPVETAPRSLDVVWCRFPLVESPNQPGPKFRPGLVRSIFVSRERQRAVIDVAYGTSRIIGMEPFELIIDADDEQLACGLVLPTCFNLQRSVRLPWAEEFFGTRMTRKGPILGRLPATAVERLRVMLNSPSR